MSPDRDRSWLFVAAMGFVVFAIIIAIASMDRTLREAAQDTFGYGGPHSDEAHGGRDLFHTGVDIGGTKGGETYAAFDARRDGNSTDGFGDFGCPGSCNTHKTGYDWAMRQSVGKVSECRGPSWAFLEGCVAYVYERRPPNSLYSQRRVALR